MDIHAILHQYHEYEDHPISKVEILDFLSFRIGSSDYCKKIKSWFFGIGSAKEYTARMWKELDLEKGLAKF